MIESGTDRLEPKMATATNIGTLIEQTPDVCGGRPRIAGTGVSVRRIAIWSQQGLSPEEIADEIESVTLPQVYAALTYYYANQLQMDEEISAERIEAQRLQQQDP